MTNTALRKMNGLPVNNATNSLFPDLNKKKVAGQNPFDQNTSGQDPNEIIDDPTKKKKVNPYNRVANSPAATSASLAARSLNLMGG